MARKPRIEFKGAFFHIITRGNQRQKIFRDEKDYKKYLEILSGYRQKYHYHLYAYVLMNNHVHLLLETRDIPLSRIQQGINQRYTMYFNKKYKMVGHLFQGRYKAILCDRDAYLLSLIKYIHLNPVRAKEVKTPEDYRWSSHKNYAERMKDDIIETNQVLRIFSENKTRARRLYREYIGDGISIKKDAVYKTVDQRILGDEEFVEQVIDNIDAGIKDKKKRHEYSLDQIAGVIEQAFIITLKQLREKSKDREISLGRKLMSIVANEYGFKGKDVAQYLRKDPSVITRYLKEKNHLREEMEKLLKLLKESSNVNKQV